MAIYHFSGQVISRSKQGKIRSAISCAAYRSGEKLFDERYNSEKIYYRKVKPVSTILLPRNAPAWAGNREKLWNAVERKEKQYNAQLAREFNIALPIELTEKEQEKLAFDFCQKAFVDRGMVADISIHRDDKNNPHFHVMLTMRPFNEKGEFAEKSRKEYVLNEKGERILLPSGNYKTRKISITGWDNKDLLKSWRKEWEIAANNSLKNNGINQRISCESNINLGSKKIATIHEGYAARELQKRGIETDKIKRNNNIKEYNDIVVEIDKYKKQKVEIEKRNKFYRNLSPGDKKELSKIAKELKIYINNDNINLRNNQLNRWRRSVEFAPDNLEKVKKLNRIEKEEVLLKEAKNILIKEANIFCDKHYNLNEKITNEQKIAITDNTISKQKLLDENEINSIIRKIEEKELQKELESIFNNRQRFVYSIKSDINNLNNKFNLCIEKYNIDFTDPKIQQKVPGNILDSMQRIYNRTEQLENALEILDNIYNIKLEEMYPEWDARESLTIEQKEIFIQAEEYYGRVIMPEDFNNLKPKYNKSEQKKIINEIITLDRKQFNELHPEFKSSGYKNMFFMECLSGDLDTEFKEIVERELDKDNLKINIKGLDIDKQNYQGKQNYRNNSMVLDILEALITEAEKRYQEQNNLQNKKKKKLRRKGVSL